MKSVKVLLVWPGTDGAAAGNFGVPQLVTMATYVREKTGAAIDIIDLYAERALGPVDLTKIFLGPDGKGYDIIGFSCYASFDFLKVEAIAAVARSLCPRAVLVAGGYHVSARPTELLEAGFDVAVVGEGEKPLVTIVESVLGGAPLRHTVLGPEPIDDLDTLPPTDWSYLERYRSVLKQVAPQVQIYLSRGCPFDCAFCMERAKREVSWRAYSVPRAIEEMRRLAAFMDLSETTLYFADALFGMRKKWRREFLRALVREKIEVKKLWLLIRVDMVDEEDLRDFAAANCALGFGLESGDPVQLATIRKAGKLDDYLDKMKFIAARSREIDLPWGANIIVGHPGETQETLRTSGKYMSELFLDPKGTTGFLSVDPFRLYPGSPIDDERGAWEARFGTRFHRPHWWNDGDQEFLSEWVDPSSELDYRTRAHLQTEVMGPILHGIGDNFIYRGKARDYFGRAIADQVENLDRRHRLHYLARHYAWNRYLGRSKRGAALLEKDLEARELFRELRRERLPRVAASLPPDARADFIASPIAEALVEVPRERFIPLDALSESAEDEALPLDDSGFATISAMHAYARTFGLAQISPGMRVLDLGGGAGYGASLLARLVGESGSVVTVELDPRLSQKARSLVPENVQTVCGSGLDLPRLIELAVAKGVFDAVVVGFAWATWPDGLEGLLAPGGVVVAPVGEGDRQTLVRARHVGGKLELTSYEQVRYVPARSAIDPSPRAERSEPREDSSTKRSLPLLTS